MLVIAAIVASAVDGPPIAVATTSTAPAAAVAHSRTIYVTHAGGTIRPGANDSRAQTSSLIDAPAALEGWAASPSDWGDVLACMRELWSPFGVEITDQDPGAVPHLEAMFVRSPTPLGMPAGIGGVAPMSTSCSVVENAIVFAFSDNVHSTRRLCEVMSQELGHAYGLDHELQADDPMTYLSYQGKRYFQDVTASCGESEPRPCGIGGHVCRADQNTFQILLERLPPESPDFDAPVLALDVDDLVISPFAVSATATDASAIRDVELSLDDHPISAVDTAPYTWNVSASPGGHRLTVTATDIAGNQSTTSADVRVDDAPATATGPIPLACSTGGVAGWPIALAIGTLLAQRRRAGNMCQ